VLEQDSQGAEAPSSAAHQPGMQPANPGRRRLGLGLGAGVLMTVKSTPGMAAAVCATPSGSLSQTFASHAPGGYKCGGVSPGYWRNNPWPANCSTKLKFGAVFADSSYTDFANYAETKMLDIVQDNINFKDQYQIGAHLVAAYLNLQAGSTTVITLAKMKLMWEKISTKQKFEAAPGEFWDGDQVVDYIKSTFHQPI
jgi:hypothetical protein